MEVYPLVNVDIANWKITIFNRSFNYKRTIFNSYVLKEKRVVTMIWINRINHGLANMDKTIVNWFMVDMSLIGMFLITGKVNVCQHRNLISKNRDLSNKMGFKRWI